MIGATKPARPASARCSKWLKPSARTPQGSWLTPIIQSPPESWKASITKSKLSLNAPMAFTMRTSSSSSSYPYTTLSTNFSGEPEMQELGYRVQDDGTILNEEGKPFSKLGARRAILNDLSPAATFIAYNYTTPADVDLFEREARRILSEVEHELAWMYETTHTDGKTKGRINFTVWSELFTCPECGGEIDFVDVAYD